METWYFYLQCSITMLLAQFSPGPDMLLLLRTALHERLSAGLWTVLGIAVGLLCHCLGSLLGLAALFQAHPGALRVVATLGAGYLLWIAWQLFQSVRKTKDEPLNFHPPAPLPPGAAFRRGLITNLTNAKAFLFIASFLAVGSQTNNSLGHRTALVAIIVGQALLGWSLLVWILQRPYAVWFYQRLERLINAVFALLLALVAAAALWAAYGHQG